MARSRELTVETSAPGVPKGPVPRLVPHKSLAERAYDILEEAIVTLELAPGSIISEQELSELTGIGPPASE
jgi:DNA-binding GntR family transcriptional regulator